jgi:hypothetical protein
MATECGNCNADFSSSDGWRPTPVPGAWKPPKTGLGIVVQVTGRLVVGIACCFAYAMLTLVLGYFFGHSAAGFLVLSWWLVFIGLVVWALLPVLRPHAPQRDGRA